MLIKMNYITLGNTTHYTTTTTKAIDGETAWGSDWAPGTNPMSWKRCEPDIKSWKGPTTAEQHGDNKFTILTTLRTFSDKRWHVCAKNYTKYIQSTCNWKGRRNNYSIQRQNITLTTSGGSERRCNRYELNTGTTTQLNNWRPML